MFEAFLPDSVKVIVVGLFAAVLGLRWLGGRLPDVEWLQVFQLPRSKLSEAQQARQRRTANRITALEIILFGLGLPLLYVVATVMMFNDFETTPTVLVLGASAVCIGIGTWILVRGR